MQTLRYYFNIGVDCSHYSYGVPMPPPPRHYSPRDLSQDMQQISLHDRPLMTHTLPEPNHKHKPGQPNDKPQMNQGKGNGQRPLLGPRWVDQDLGLHGVWDIDELTVTMKCLIIKEDVCRTRASRPLPRLLLAT